MSSSFRWPLGRLGRASIAVGLAIAGLVLVGVAVAGPSDSRRNPRSLRRTGPTRRRRLSARLSRASERPTARADHTDLRDRITGLVLPESDPVAVSIPRIRAQSELVELGLDEHGEMDVPEDPARAGWFSARGRARRTGAGGHRRSRDVGRRSCGLPSPGHREARRSGDRDPEGWENCRLQRHPGGPILEVEVPEPGGLRRNRPRWAATDHVWRHVRRSQAASTWTMSSSSPDWRPCTGLVADDQAWSALDHEHERLRRHARVGVQHAKPVPARPSQLDVGGEPAGPVGLGG